ncbi:hypothetical protein ACRQ5D_07900 [Mucilaginibacter sp. P25]|uniref:hypothetical protein n=1 Tax=unclassified Mucilaginibacter TaxID=2617802 RepID=UPI003D66EF60
MKILILTHRVPFPQNGGYAIVVCNTIKGLIALGHEVALVALNGKRYHGSVQTGEDELMQKIRYTSYDININISVLDSITNLFRKNQTMLIVITMPNLKNSCCANCARRRTMLSSLKACL